MAELYVSIMGACEGWLTKAGEIALHLLTLTAIIGFAIGVKDLALAGHVTLDGIVALFVRYAFIVGLLVWLLSTPQRLGLIPLSIKEIGRVISGQDIGFGSLMTLFGEVTNPLVEFTAGLSWTDIGLIICMTFVIFLINALFFMIAATVLVVEIEAVFIMIGGLFTASFFVIGYFKDAFLGYIRALATVGVKMLMLCLCLGIMRNIMAEWPAMIAAQLADAGSVFSFLMPISCALLGFYMILKAVPQFASSILTGHASGMDGGAVRAAALAGYGLGATVVSTSRMAAQKFIGGASVVSQAAQTYQYTAQAARDTGSADSAKAVGAKEAAATVMTGAQPGGPRGAGERIYSDYQRGQQFADVRNAGGQASNTMAAPVQANTAVVADSTAAVSAAALSAAATGANHDPYTMPSSQINQEAGMGNVSIAGSTSSASSVSESSGADSWGSFASDKKKGERKG
jgi:hypothetical protein